MFLSTVCRMQEDLEKRGSHPRALKAAAAQEHTHLQAKGSCEKMTLSHFHVDDGNIQVQPRSTLDVQRDAGEGVSKVFGAQPAVSG